MYAEARAALLTPGSLAARAMGAGAWSIVGLGLQYPLKLAGNLVMARILAPEDFGLMAVVLVLHLGLGLLADVGIQQSVMRHPEGGSTPYLRMAWSLQIVRALSLAALVLLLGGAVAVLGPGLAAPDSVYADARLPWLISTSALTVLLTGLQSASVLLAAREMRVKDLIAVETSAQVLGLVVMIGLALLLEDVWALLYGAVAAAAAKTALSHIMTPGPAMRWHWDRQQAREMWSYGKWIIGASVGGFLATHGDQLVFSAIMDKSLFGVYAIAGLWVSIGGQILARIAATVFIPTFGEVLNHRPEDAPRVLGRAFRAYSLICIGVAVAVLVTALLVVSHVYDERYAAALPIVMVLAFRNLVLRYSVVRQFIIAAGDSRHVALTSLGGGLIGIAGLYAAFSWGGLPAALAVAALMAVPMFAGTLWQREVRRHIPWAREVAVLAAISTACLTVAYAMPS